MNDAPNPNREQTILYANALRLVRIARYALHGRANRKVASAGRANGPWWRAFGGWHPGCKPELAILVKA